MITSQPLPLRQSKTGIKLAIAAALLMLFTATYFIGFPAKLPPVPPATGPITAATLAAPNPDDNLPPPPADLAPTDLKFTRVSININNFAGEDAAQKFSEQVAYTVQLAHDFPPTPPISLQLQNVPYLDALIQFAGRINGTFAAFASDDYALIVPNNPLPTGTWTVSGPLAAYLAHPEVDLLDTLPNPQVIGMQFLIEPQNTRTILFPDTILIETFEDDLHQAIQLRPGRDPVPGPSYHPGHRSLTIPLQYAPIAGKRVAILKGTAPFRLVTRTQTLATKTPADRVTLPFGEPGEGGATVEFSPLTTRLDGPFDMYRNFQCDLIFHRNQMNAEDWHMFIIHFTQAKATFIDNHDQPFPAFPSSSSFPRDDQSVNITFTTSANEKRTEPQSIRLEIPVESRRILLPFEFSDFPLP